MGKILNIIIFFFIIVAIWAGNSELDQTVRAEAIVEPAGKIQVVQSRYQGVIATINVEVGNTVSKGDVVVSLDVEDIQISKRSTDKKIGLLRDKLNLYAPLVERGIEPRITIIDIATQISDLEEKSEKYAVQIRNSGIISNTAGIVTAVHMNGIGQVLKGGESLIEIVPSTDHYFLKAKVLPKDIAKISVGQEARASFVAYDFSVYGSMSATISKVAKNSTTTQDGFVYYDAWVRINTADGSESKNKDMTILPGMNATIDILGEKRSLIEYVFSPLKKGMSKALSE